jgi:hypothetical protein
MKTMIPMDQMSLQNLQLAASKRAFNRKTLPIKAKKTTTKTKRSVSFSNMATFTTRSISEQDLRTMWYEDEEYGAFFEECKRTVAAIKKADGGLSTLDPTEFCVRGLEQFLCPKEMIARQNNTKKYIRVMLRQQYVQRRIGQSDPGRLQALSELFSKNASKRASLRGITDHASAE